MLKRPVVIVNVKTYPQTTGQGARSLAQAAQRISDETGAGMALAVQAADVRLVADTGLPVLAQHIEPRTPGAHTGYDLMPSLHEAGARGTLINHSEHRLTLADIDACIEQCRDQDWLSVVCTNNVMTTRAAAIMSPHYVAVEPPELIGGDISVTTADPDIIRRSADAIRDLAPHVKLLCGAGIKDGTDVATAIELGAEGVLLASGVAKAKDPQAVLRDLVSQV